MSDQVWMSNVLMGGSGLANELGLREKFYGQDWCSPGHVVPRHEFPADYSDQYRAHRLGVKVDRIHIPEASYVFDDASFKGLRELFSAGGFYAVTEELAELLRQFDLGETELIPYPIYKQDKKTLLEGQYYVLNLGARKNTLLPDECVSIRTQYENENGPVWKTVGSRKTFEIAVSEEALLGADMWVETQLWGYLFFSDRLRRALVDAEISILRELNPVSCDVVDGEAAQ